MKRPPPTLDYSSRPIGGSPILTPEQERRIALDNYNESTFGERHPFRSLFVRIGALIGLWLLLSLFLPHGIAYLIVVLAIAGERVWDARKNGFSPGRSQFLNDPLLWWPPPDEPGTSEKSRPPEQSGKWGSP
jgi:hypothetical protein